jgi:hypothetical protein
LGITPDSGNGSAFRRWMHIISRIILFSSLIRLVVSVSTVLPAARLPCLCLVGVEWQKPQSLQKFGKLCASALEQSKDDLLSGVEDDGCDFSLQLSLLVVEPFIPSGYQQM